MEMVMRLCLAACLLVALVASANAQPARIDRIDVVEFGIYTADSKLNSVTAQGIKQSTIDNVRHAATTTTIPVQKDVQFGYRYKIIGKPNGAPVDIRLVTNYPAPGLRTPSSEQPVMRSERIRKRQIGETSVTTYSLEDDFELVPGIWTFEIYDGDRKLVSQSFTLVKSPQ
jgi:hypothetical protein